VAAAAARAAALAKVVPARTLAEVAAADAER